MPLNVPTCPLLSTKQAENAVLFLFLAEISGKYRHRYLVNRVRDLLDGANALFFIFILYLQ